MLKQSFEKKNGRIIKKSKYENVSLEIYINIYNLTSNYILVKHQSIRN